MKVIDLLNMISKGEEVPEKIQVYSDIFIFDYSNKVYEHEETRTNLLSIYNGNILNYEVRIKEEPRNIEVCGSLFTRSEYNRLAGIKEDKKIEKVDVNHLQQIKKWKRAKVLGNKINEIIDKINEMRKDK